MINEIIALDNFSDWALMTAEGAIFAGARETRCSALEGDPAIDRVAHLERFQRCLESDRERKFFRA